jgi:predicted RecB family nuclease
MAGCKCSKYLWLKVHEPDADELVVNERVRDLFEQGHQVGALARQRFPDGVLIDLDYDDPRRGDRTRELMAAGTIAIFEASLAADGIAVAIDVLLREPHGFTLIEVKSGSDPKEKYILDAAFQTYIARRAGVPIERVEIMHLNGDYLHPGPLDLLVRTDVTADVEALQPLMPARIAEQRAVLAGSQPEVPIGQHCREPDECPFMGRCWPDQADGVLRIHGLLFEKRFALFHGGVASIAALPAAYKLNEVQQRQRRSIERAGLVVEPSLREALAPYGGRLGFLDFESVSRAVPRWEGTKPWQNVGVQFSYHELQPDGTYRHDEYLAPSDCDPREEIAARLVETTSTADQVVMYTPFEKTQIRLMKTFVPALAGELDALEARLLDLKQVVHRNVYHPAFGGSFSIKDVLPALTGITYKDTVTIADGQEASVKLARLLFYAYEMTEAQRAALKAELLAYCKQDTWAMVKLLERLQQMT